MAAGRPPQYNSSFNRQAVKLCELGATDAELADFFGVTERTIYRWQTKFPEFCHALKAGKESADERVVRSLYHRAVGYSYEAVKIFNDKGAPLYAPFKEHVPPDVTAAIFWLKNRRPDDWREKQQVDFNVPPELAAKLWGE